MLIKSMSITWKKLIIVWKYQGHMIIMNMSLIKSSNKSKPQPQSVSSFLIKKSTNRFSVVLLRLLRRSSRLILDLFRWGNNQIRDKKLLVDAKRGFFLEIFTHKLHPILSGVFHDICFKIFLDVFLCDVILKIILS